MTSCGAVQQETANEMTAQHDSTNEKVNKEIIQQYEGIYMGKNLYLQNSYSKIGQNGWCVQRIEINDKTLNIDYMVESFEIGFDSLEIGDTVLIRLVFAEGCTPKWLNLEVINPTD